MYRGASESVNGVLCCAKIIFFGCIGKALFKKSAKMSMAYHASIGIKILKLILNIIIVIMYRHGDEGYFLGASFNKNRDAETLAAGVYIGYLIYNLTILISIFFDSQSVRQSVSETIMNVIGFLLWIILAGVVIHFWIRFIPANHYITTNPNAVGIAMGALTLINSALYLGEALLTFLNYRQTEAEKY